jgi:hypothetical protein
MRGGILACGCWLLAPSSLNVLSCRFQHPLIAEDIRISEIVVSELKFGDVEWRGFSTTFMGAADDCLG